MSTTDTAEYHYERALQFRKSFEEAAVLDEISKAIAIQELPEYYLQKAWALLCLKHVGEASKALDLLAMLMTTKPSTRVDVQELESLQKECALQEGRIIRQQELQRSSEESYRVALEHQKEGRFEDARTAIKEALRVESKPKYFIVLARACLRLGFLEDAGDCLRKVAPADEGVGAGEFDELYEQFSKSGSNQKAQAKLINKAVEERDANKLVGVMIPDKVIDSANLILSSQRLVVAKGNAVAPGKSKIGGKPDLPPDHEWPCAANKAPLYFLCQLNLAELDQKNKLNLPNTGMLYFFYNAKDQPWGFDPADKGQWKVIYSASSSNLRPAAEPGELDGEFVVKQRTVSFDVEQTFPNVGEDCFADSHMSSETWETYVDALEKWYGELPWHRLFGHPQNIQTSMELECQLASSGLQLGKATPEEELLADADASNWILLLQLDTDESQGMMWGDGGRLYFWIRRDDLSKLNFDNVWVVLQCY